MDQTLCPHGLGKLGLEDDAYHATCLVLMEYSDELVPPGADKPPEPEGILEPGPLPQAEESPSVGGARTGPAVPSLPKVTVRRDQIPQHLAPGRFLGAMVARVLGATPVNMHEEARRRRAAART